MSVLQRLASVILPRGGGLMPRIEFPNFAGPEYDYSVPFYGASQLDASRCQNLYPDTALPSSRQRRFLIARPGMSAYTTLAASPVRGIMPDSNIIYVVSGTHLYQVQTGASVTDFGSMPGSTGVAAAKLIKMGGGTSANTTVVQDSSSSQIYTYNGTNMVSQFNGRYLEYMDGFAIAVANGASLQNASQPNQINVSAFGDATNWIPGPAGTQAFAVRSGASDFVNALAVLNGFLWVFGLQATEIWFNAGTSPFPFQRYQGATINLGCIAPFSVVKFFNTIIWLGQDHTGYAQVYMSKGMSPVKISDPYIEGYLSNIANTLGDQYLRRAWAHGYQEAGHTFYVLLFGDGGLGTTTQRTALVYDLTEGIWHSRQYGGVIPCCEATAPGQLSGVGIANFVGSATSGQVLQQSLANTGDITTGGANQSIAYVRQAPYVEDLTKVVMHRRFEVIGNFGTAVPSLSYSDDFGVTYKNAYQLNGPGTDVGFNPGATGFQRYYALELGRSRGRIYQLNITDTFNHIRMAGATLDLDAGDGQ